MTATAQDFLNNSMRSGQDALNNLSKQASTYGNLSNPADFLNFYKQFSQMNQGQKNDLTAGQNQMHNQMAALGLGGSQLDNYNQALLGQDMQSRVGQQNFANWAGLQNAQTGINQNLMGMGASSTVNQFNNDFTQQQLDLQRKQYQDSNSIGGFLKGMAQKFLGFGAGQGAFAGITPFGIHMYDSFNKMLGNKNVPAYNAQPNIFNPSMR